MGEKLKNYFKQPLSNQRQKGGVLAAGSKHLFSLQTTAPCVQLTFSFGASTGILKVSRYFTG